MHIAIKLEGNATLLLSHHLMLITDIKKNLKKHQNHTKKQNNPPTRSRRCQYGLLASKHKENEGKDRRVCLQLTQRGTQNRNEATLTWLHTGKSSLSSEKKDNRLQQKLLVIVSIQDYCRHLKGNRISFSTSIRFPKLNKTHFVVVNMWKCL